MAWEDVALRYGDWHEAVLGHEYGSLDTVAVIARMLFGKSDVTFCKEVPIECKTHSVLGVALLTQRAGHTKGPHKHLLVLGLVGHAMALVLRLRGKRGFLCWPK